MTLHTGNEIMEANNTEYIPVLMAIGLTNLEAEIYITLLQDTELTGYRIAKILGKPVANTYKALESLGKKGAVLLEESANSKIYSAVPITDYLNLMEEQFKLKRKNAEATLKDMKKFPVEKGIYKLQTVESVYERCKSMLEKAQHVILADVFPIPLDHLRNDLENAAKNKGIETHVKVYQTVDLPDCHIINSFNADELLDLWPEQWIILTIDLKESLIAAISRDGRSVEYAIWTKNPYITFIVYNGSMNEMISFTMQNLLSENESSDFIREYVQKYKKIVTFAKENALKN